MVQQASAGKSRGCSGGEGGHWKIGEGTGGNEADDRAGSTRSERNKRAALRKTGSALPRTHSSRRGDETLRDKAATGEDSTAKTFQMSLLSAALSERMEEGSVVLCIPYSVFRIPYTAMLQASSGPVAKRGHGERRILCGPCCDARTSFLQRKVKSIMSEKTVIRTPESVRCEDIRERAARGETRRNPTAKWPAEANSTQYVVPQGGQGTMAYNAYTRGGEHGEAEAGGMIGRAGLEGFVQCLAVP